MDQKIPCGTTKRTFCPGQTLVVRRAVRGENVRNLLKPELGVLTAVVRGQVGVFNRVKHRVALGNSRGKRRMGRRMHSLAVGCDDLGVPLEGILGGPEVLDQGLEAFCGHGRLTGTQFSQLVQLRLNRSVRGTTGGLRRRRSSMGLPGA